MPTRTTTRRRARTPKAAHVGSSRREALAASKPSKEMSRRAATGLARNPDTVRLPSPIHAKKDTRETRAPRAGQVAVATPNVPGYVNFVDAEKYDAMKEILLRVLPRKAPGLTQGEMFEAVREAAARGAFPGATHRWWAKCVQLDLEAKGTLVREPTTPMRWHLR